MPEGEDHGAANTEEAAAAGPRDWSGQFARLVGVVHSFPYAVILTAGIFAVLASFVRRIGGWELVTEGSQFFVLGVGAALTVIGLGGPVVESRRMTRSLSGYRLDGKPLPDEAMDVEFLFQVFYLCMPPAFVKRFGPPAADGSRRAVDIVYSRELDRFQRSGSTREVADDLRHRAISADHDRGDQLAVKNGSSLMLEFPTSYVDGRLSHILCRKTSFEYRGETYVAGWYVPVELPEESRSAETVTLKDEVGQPVLRPVVVEDGQGLRVPIGAAARTQPLTPTAADPLPPPRGAPAPRR